MDIIFECPKCKEGHTLSDKEFNKLTSTDECKYKCNCGKINKIIQDDCGEFDIS